MGMNMSLCVHAHLQAPPTAASTAQPTCPSSVIKRTWPSLLCGHYTKAHKLQSEQQLSLPAVPFQTSSRSFVRDGGTL